MIEIELFQYDSEPRKHNLKIWLNKKLVCDEEIGDDRQLLLLRDAFYNELLWLNSYIRKSEIKDVQGS